MYGMLTSLVAASFILAAANYLALPVSTTYTIVGSIVDFSLAAKGFSSIQWMEVGKVFISVFRVVKFDTWYHMVTIIIMLMFILPSC